MRPARPRIREAAASAFPSTTIARLTLILLAVLSITLSESKLPDNIDYSGLGTAVPTPLRSRVVKRFTASQHHINSTTQPQPCCPPHASLRLPHHSFKHYEPDYRCYTLASTPHPAALNSAVLLPTTLSMVSSECDSYKSFTDQNHPLCYKLRNRLARKQF